MENREQEFWIGIRALEENEGSVMMSGVLVPCSLAGEGASCHWHLFL